jgi:predicted Zn-dependent protease
MVGTINNKGELEFGGQLGLAINDLSMFSEAMDSLTESFEKEELTTADYKAGLDQIFDGTMTSLETLNELDRTMKSYYSETLSKVSEEIEKFSSAIEHSSTVLDHYKNLFGILGKENNYKFMATILQGQASVAKNSFNASKKAYAVYTEEAEKWKNKMAEVPENSEEWKQYKNNWEAAVTKAQESQDQMLTNAEDWAEKEKAIIENALSDLAKTLEESLTGGMSFE